MAIFVTYDNQTLQDGLGAQALRITGIYAISKAFRLHYLHTPIARVIEDVGQNPENDAEQANLIAFFNDFFSFPGGRNPKLSAEHCHIRDLSFRSLIRIILKKKLSRHDVVIHILLPQGLIDRKPSIYKYAAHQLRKSNARLINHSHGKTLVAHVRRGYDEKYADLKYARNRHLPFSYYSDVINYLCRNEMIPFGSTLDIHTDLLNVPTKWTPKQSGILDGFNKNSGTHGKDSIDLEAYDLSQEIIVPNGYSLEIHYCDPLITSFLDMCNAKTLIQGKSALSYLAGIINSGLVIFPPRQSMSKLPNWKSASDYMIELREPLLG